LFTQQEESHYIIFMHLLPQTKRPHASYSCPKCREINVLEASDIKRGEMVITVNCLACGQTHKIEQSYMQKQLERDLATS